MRRTGLLISAFLGLVACSDPYAGVERLSDVELAEDAAPIDFATDDAKPALTGEGFLGRMLRGGQTKASEPVTAEPADAGQSYVGQPDAGPPEDTAAADPQPAGNAAPPRGLLGGLFAGADRTQSATNRQEGTRLASIGRDGDSPRTTRAPRAAAEPDLPLNAPLSFGQVVRACSASKADLGQRLQTFPERGRGYALYDSNPGSTAPRSFFVTGFSDDCPRRFIAANAVFGSPSMHEQLRYGLPSDLYPYSETDKAYERVKSSICGVSRRKPCGARIKRVERNTVFISAYERFGGGNPRWADILVHDGAVMAATVKTP